MWKWHFCRGHGDHGVFVVMVPSLDEIQQRRADLKQLKEYPLQVRKTSDGTTVVRVMSKKPCYAFGDSKIYDWCPIDPKNIRSCAKFR